jgi:hypothetical protein
MTYESPPSKGAVGEVVNVKSANGDITHHEGKVFVQWDDGEFRSIHAEHLRLATTSKTTSKTASLVQTVRAQNWRGLMQDVKSLQRKWRQDREMTKALNSLDFYADESWMGEDSGRYPGKAYALAKKLDAAFAAGYPNAAGMEIFSKRATSDKTARDQNLMTWTYSGSDGDGGKTTTVVAEIIVDGRGNLLMEESYKQEDWGGAPARSHTTTERLGTVRDPDLQMARRIFSDKKKGWTARGGSVRSPIQHFKKMVAYWDSKMSGRRADKVADLKAEFKKIKDLAKKKPDNKFLDSVLEQLSKGHTLTEKQLKVIKTIEGEVKEMASMQKELKSLGKVAVNFNKAAILKAIQRALGDGELTGQGLHLSEVVLKVQSWVGEAEPFVAVSVAGSSSWNKGREYFNEDYPLEGFSARRVAKDIRGSQARTHLAESKTFRVASLGDLTDFLKVSEETLVHKSTNDLWSIAADGDGFTLTRLFDDEGTPLQG